MLFFNLFLDSFRSFFLYKFEKEYIISFPEELNSKRFEKVLMYYKLKCKGALFEMITSFNAYELAVVNQQIQDNQCNGFIRR